MIRIAVDPKGFFAKGLNELETKELPFALMQAINVAAFETRQRWAEVMPRIFDRPTALTLKAPLYTKATKAKPEATIFIRDEVSKGTPPAKYLLSQVEGGSRRAKGVEKRLTNAGVLAAGMFVVPGRGAKLDSFGNVPGRQITALLSAVGAQFDRYQNATPESRKRRRSRKKVRGGDYFAVKFARGKLKPGIYERIATGFGSAIRSVLFFVRSVRYRQRYDIYGIARKIFERRLPAIFQVELDKAVRSAFARAFR